MLNLVHLVVSYQDVAAVGIVAVVAFGTFVVDSLAFDRYSSPCYLVYLVVVVVMGVLFGVD